MPANSMGLSALTRTNSSHSLNNPRRTNELPLRALWSLLDGIWGLLKGSWGVLEFCLEMYEVLEGSVALFADIIGLGAKLSET